MESIRRTRKPAGKTEEASVLGVAAVLASWLAPKAEAASSGAGQAVTVLIMAAVPFAAKLIRDRLNATLGQAVRGELGKARDVLIVLMVAGGLLGCAPLIAKVPVSADEGAESIVVWAIPSGDSRICVSPVERGGEDADGEVEGTCTVTARGGHVSETFGNLVQGLANIVGAVFGGTRAQQPASPEVRVVIVDSEGNPR